MEFVETNRSILVRSVNSPDKVRNKAILQLKHIIDKQNSDTETIIKTIRTIKKTINTSASIDPVFNANPIVAGLAITTIHPIETVSISTTASFCSISSPISTTSITTVEQINETPNFSHSLTKEISQTVVESTSVDKIQNQTSTQADDKLKRLREIAYSMGLINNDVKRLNEIANLGGLVDPYNLNHYIDGRIMTAREVAWREAGNYGADCGDRDCPGGCRACFNAQDRDRYEDY